MIDDLLSLKAATIERCVRGAREEYTRDPNTSAADRPAQDAAILNILRARQLRLDMGQHLIHRERIDAPQSIDDRAHAPAWARIPAVPAAGREASTIRAPTQERGSHRKVRFRGLAKNTAQLVTLFALSNLWMMRKRLLMAGEVRA